MMQQVEPMQAEGFYPPPGYVVCMMLDGVQIPPSAVFVPEDSYWVQMAQMHPQMQQPCMQPLRSLKQAVQSARSGDRGHKSVQFDISAPRASGEKKACRAEPALEPAAREQRAPLESEADRHKRLLRLGSGAKGMSLLATRVHVMQTRRGDHSTFSALNIDTTSSKQAKKAPQLRFLKELEEQKRLQKQQSVATEATATPLSISAGEAGESSADAGCRNGQEALARDAVAQAPGSGAAFAQACAALLSFRGLAPRQVPEELLGLRAASELKPEVQRPSLQRQLSAPTQAPQALPAPPVLRRQHTPPAPETAASQLAVKRSSLGELEILRRDVNSLLNKVCPEKFATVVEKLTAIQVNSAEALEIVIDLIFKKALSEPHYSETYADLVFSLGSAFPEFPRPDGGKPGTFKSSVLSICQSEFEELLAIPQPSEDEKVGREGEEVDMLCQARRERMRANMRFVGHLFLRQLQSAKVVGSIIRELVLCDMEDMAPQEHALECACELLNTVGFTLEALPAGKVLLPAVFARLRVLKAQKNDEGTATYTKRVQFMIQDLIDTWEAGWTRKVFRASAKTKEEIRLDSVSGPGQVGETVVVGQRPLYLTAKVERFLRARTA